MPASIQRGFTLTEAMVVIVITGIIVAVVAVFIPAPVKGYFDTTRRAQLSDVADTAVRRVTRDLRLALPNSIRVTSSGGVSYLEFLLTRSGGRYRAERDSGGGGDVLEFGSAANPFRFDVIGPAPALVANADQVVVRVRDGTLLMFPSWLHHSVNATASTELRISVSFNLMFDAFAETVSPPMWSGR